ncbi:MAG TPA: lipopolysaccharide assembly protein LapA domain-containing protein [Ignavibacteriaceae bacterium]
MNFKNISLLVLLALFIIVCIQNVEIISVQFLFWKAEISKLLLLIITWIIGLLIGMIIPGFLTKSKKEDKTKDK